MSDKPISVGDLVQVVRDHCGDGLYLGKIFTAPSPIKSWTGHFKCERCAARWPCSEDLFEHKPGGYIPRTWLKRIPDFPDLKDERHDEEITA